MIFTKGNTISKIILDIIIAHTWDILENNKIIHDVAILKNVIAKDGDKDNVITKCVCKLDIEI